MKSTKLPNEMCPQSFQIGSSRDPELSMRTVEEDETPLAFPLSIAHNSCSLALSVLTQSIFCSHEVDTFILLGLNVLTFIF